jgi:hypothetical protein
MKTSQAVVHTSFTVEVRSIYYTSSTVVHFPELIKFARIQQDNIFFKKLGYFINSLYTYGLIYYIFNIY